MNFEIQQKHLTEIDVSLLPEIEHVFIPTITSSFDDPVTQATVSIDIDGTIYHKVYEDSSSVESDVDTFKDEASLVITTADTDETISLSTLDAGEYVLAIYAENNYGDGTEIETKAFTIE